MELLKTFVLLILSYILVECKDQCIAGKYHKKSPTQEKVQYPECAPWRDKTCCTSQFARELKANQTIKLYNHDWHLCKKLSTQCERFWINQECFYQCSPYVYKWKQASGDPSFDGLKGVPICASVCDRWYQACKDDEICVENVLTDYNFTEHGRNSCPKNKPCMTYEKMYGSGKSLCEKMWGNSYVHTQEDRNSSNCMVMWFSGSNPNARVQPKKTSGCSRWDFHVFFNFFTMIIFQSVLLSMYVSI